MTYRVNLLKVCLTLHEFSYCPKELDLIDLPPGSMVKRLDPLIVEITIPETATLSPSTAHRLDRLSRPLDSLFQ
jgi:hypothetical protein